MRSTGARFCGLRGWRARFWHPGVNLELLARRTGRATLAVPVVLVVLGGAAILLISGSAVLGQLGVVLAMAWVGSVGMALGLVGGSPLRNMVPVVLTVLSALVVVGHVYANVPSLRRWCWPRPPREPGPAGSARLDGCLPGKS